MSIVSGGLTINQEKAIRAGRVAPDLRPRLELFEKLGRVVAQQAKIYRQRLDGIGTPPARRRMLAEQVDDLLAELGLTLK